MKQFNHAKGVLGEQIALDYLKKKKYKILDRNVKGFAGEIDIVAQQGSTIVFVEVKSRSSAGFGLPREAVTDKKQHKIRYAAIEYLKKKKLLSSPVRFDVIEILDEKINHLENCF